MDIKKQKLLTEYLISSADTFALCASITQPEYFDPELRNTISFIKKYYDEYNSTPTVDQIEGETGVKLKLQEVSKDQISYCANEVEAFCKRKAIEKAILASPALIEKEDYGLLAIPAICIRCRKTGQSRKKAKTAEKKKSADPAGCR